jgi:hypoxanthine-guanine phosphoribosyltransferase
MEKMKTRRITRRKNYNIEHKTIQAHAEKFRGQHVIVVGTDIVGSKNGDTLARLLRQMEKRHPKRVPLISFVPEKDKIYIL